MATNQFDDTMKNKIAALSRVRRVTRCYRDGEDNIPCKIEEGLFLGSFGAANNKEELKRLNVTHVLTVASLRPPHLDDFVSNVVTVQDKSDTCIVQYFNECFDFIDEGKRQGGVLVHCFRGISRSVTVVVAYLMKRHGMSLSQALEHVKRERQEASPNSGFVLQLRDLEKSLREGKGLKIQSRSEEQNTFGS